MAAAIPESTGAVSISVTAGSESDDTATPVSAKFNADEFAAVGSDTLDETAVATPLVEREASLRVEIGVAVFSWTIAPVANALDPSAIDPVAVVVTAGATTPPIWVVAPTPNATFEITLAYIKQPTSLTDSSVSSTGTYVSNKYQDLLLYGTLVEAYGYLKGPADMLQYYEASFKRALQSYAIEQQGRRRRDEWQDGAIRTPLKSESPSKY